MNENIMLQVSSKKREERRFNNVESGAKNCVFIKTTIQAFLQAFVSNIHFFLALLSSLTSSLFLK